MSERAYPASEMGPQLLAFVERQLLDDLHHYDVKTDGASFDWSDVTQEGHVTHHLDGTLEDMSGVLVVGPDGQPRARGWIDFVHGASDAPLFVFWLYLDRRDGEQWTEVKDRPTLPKHVWSRLPVGSKELCATEGRYDARWSTDPLVVAWRASRG